MTMEDSKMNMKDREEKNAVLASTLYLVSTPIGNLSDLSERAVKVLSEVDIIAAEDTRNTMKLLSFSGISKPMISYHEHNKRESGGRIIEELLAGRSCALVTDAGTPAISDPGEDLVRLATENNINVTSIPGPCAAITALSLSALSTRRFVFEGFLEGTRNQRLQRLSELKNEGRTIIFYEAPHNMRQTLELMCETFGNKRRTAICRELTKINEEVMRTTLSGALEYYTVNEPRGEYVIVLDGAKPGDDDSFFSHMSVAEHVEYYTSAGLSVMDAVKQTARDRGVAKSVIYKEIHNSKNESD